VTRVECQEMRDVKSMTLKILLATVLAAWCGLGFASSTGGRAAGAASVMGCAGGPPDFCGARQDLGIQTLLPWPANPTVGVPFIGDFGERVVRVTDANTTLGAVTANQAFATNSSSDANQIAGPDFNLDPTCGGDRLIVGTTGGTDLPFWIDRCTMAITPVTMTYGSKPGVLPISSITAEFAKNDPAVTIGTMGAQPASQVWVYCWPSSKASNYCGSDNPHGSPTTYGDTAVDLYDFAGCPNLPAQTGSYAGDIGATDDGTKISHVWGTEQGETWIIAVATLNTTTAPPTVTGCDWYDTMNGTVGGTDFPGYPNGEPTNPQWLMTPPLAVNMQTVTDANGLTAGTWRVQETFVSLNKAGTGISADPETTASPINTITVSSGQGIQFLTPVIGTDVGTDEISNAFTGYTGTSMLQEPYQVKIYACPGMACTPYLQAAVKWFGGSQFPFTLDSLNYNASSSTPPPSVNTAGFDLHGGRISPSGLVSRVSTQGGIYQAKVYWFNGTNNVSVCTFTVYHSDYPPSGNCEGHPADGFNVELNASPHGTSPYNQITGQVKRPYTNLFNLTQLFPDQGNLFPNAAGLDSHCSWVDNVGSDTVPFSCIVYNMALSDTDSSDGTQSLTNPAVAPSGPMVNEVAQMSSTGDEHVWRIAHTHTSAIANNLIGNYGDDSATDDYMSEPIGVVSQDGRFVMFQSDDLWQLGTDNQNTWSAHTLESKLWTSSACSGSEMSGGCLPQMPYLLQSQPVGTVGNAGPYELLIATGTTGTGSRPNFSSTIGAWLQDGTAYWETIPGCPADANFPGYPAASFGTVPTGYTIQDPAHQMEVAQNSGSISSGAVAPQWPEWNISSMSASAGVVTVTLASAIPSSSNIAVGSVIDVTGSSNSTFNNGGNNATHWTVASVTLGGTTLTFNDASASGTSAGGLLEFDGGTVTDGSGITWKMYELGNKARGYLRLAPVPECRTDDFIVEAR
jgi:hypothetical protein